MGVLPWAQLMKDAKDAPAASYDLLPAGDYLVTVTKAETTTTQKSGETMFRMRATVQGGEHNGRMVFPNLIVPGPTADKARPGYFLNDCKNIGLTDAFLASQPDTAAIESALLGKQFIAQLEVAPRRDNPAEKTNNVKRIKRFTGQAPASPAAGAPGQAPAPQQAQPTPQPQPQPVQFQPQPTQQPAPQQQPVQQQPQYAPQPQQQPVQQPQYQPQQQQPVQQPVQQPAPQPVQQQPQQPQYEAEAPQQPQQQPAAAAPAEQQYTQPQATQQPQEAPPLPQSPFAAFQQ